MRQAIRTRWNCLQAKGELLSKMPVELEIIKASEFIRLGGHGEFDLAASCGVLATIAQACRKRGIHRALIDARNARAQLSDTEIAALVNVFREIGFSRDLRLAILHAPERHYRPRLFASLSRLKGWNVKAFSDFEQSLSWLSAAPRELRPSHNHHDENGIPVPIRSTRQRPRANLAKI